MPIRAVHCGAAGMLRLQHHVWHEVQHEHGQAQDDGESQRELHVFVPCVAQFTNYKEASYIRAQEGKVNRLCKFSKGILVECSNGICTKFLIQYKYNQQFYTYNTNIQDVKYLKILSFRLYRYLHSQIEYHL